MVSRNRLVLITILVICLVFTTSAFILTERAYIASLNTETASAEVVGTEVIGSGDDLSLAVTIEITNPTRHRFTVWSIVLDVKMERTRITDRSTDFGTWTVAAGETETETIELPVKADHRKLVRDEYDPATVRIEGYVWARIIDSEIVLTIGTPDPTDKSTPTPQASQSRPQLPPANLAGG